MSAATVSVQQATIRQYAKRLQLAAIGGQFAGVGPNEPIERGQIKLTKARAPEPDLEALSPT
jgi:hypothetical protein